MLRPISLSIYVVYVGVMKIESFDELVYYSSYEPSVHTVECSFKTSENEIYYLGVERYTGIGEGLTNSNFHILVRRNQDNSAPSKEDRRFMVRCAAAAYSIVHNYGDDDES